MTCMRCRFRLCMNCERGSSICGRAATDFHGRLWSIVRGGSGIRLVRSWADQTSGQTEIGAFHVFLEALADLNEPGVRARLTQADAAVLLLQFLDRASLEAARAFLQALPPSVGSACGVVFVYPREERKFKISCEGCGQKLWVLETEIGRRGRCPSCMKPLRIPSPPEAIRKHLGIPDTVPVLSVVEGEAALCRGALANLLVRAIAAAPSEGSTSPQEFLKRATVAIQLPKVP